MRKYKPNYALGALAGIFILLCANCHGAMPEIDLSNAAGDVFPGESWQKIGRPEQLGWSSPKLAEARQYAGQIGSAAVMIVDDGIVIDAWGDTSRNFKCHSVRKSLLSILMGIYATEGAVDLSESLADLNINDYPHHLSETERQATVGDLLGMRSGIYIEALGESPEMKARRPERHSHAPGTFWYYNNWDANALGTIFEQKNGRNIFRAFRKRLAEPLQMQDFDPADCRYLDNNDYGSPGISMHRYYSFRMSARDLARLGLLFLREGRWRNDPVLPPEWVRRSTASLSRVGSGSGYGYMWWTGTGTGLFENVHLKGHTYAAAGWGGHRLIVLPWRKLVVVHRVNTDRPHNSVDNYKIGRLLWHILDAAGETGIGDRPTLAAAKGALLTHEELGSVLPGSSIRSPNFRVELKKDYRFEFWSGSTRVDSGTWGIQGDHFWLQTPIVTGGHKVKLRLALHDDRIKWFDSQGTLQGQGTLKKEEK